MALRSPAAVAEAERAFAALARKAGTPAAFLATLTESAVVFTPRPANAHAVHRARPDDPSRLVWEPEFVELAASGDFALSTGPWRWSPREGAEPKVHGHFLSLWVLEAGRWRVILDVGTPHPEQAAAPLTLRALPPAPDPTAGDTLAAAWKAFDAHAGRDVFGALQAFGAKDFRSYRKGEPLRAGTQPPAPEGFVPATWVEGGRHVAASTDLALRWGTRSHRGVTHSAVQVWRREGAGWRLAMDVEVAQAEP